MFEYIIWFSMVRVLPYEDLKFGCFPSCLEQGIIVVAVFSVVLLFLWFFLNLFPSFCSFSKTLTYLSKGIQLVPKSDASLTTDVFKCSSLSLLSLSSPDSWEASFQCLMLENMIFNRFLFFLISAQSLRSHFIMHWSFLSRELSYLKVISSIFWTSHGAWKRFNTSEEWTFKILALD